MEMIITDSKPKQVNRNLIRDYIKKHMTPKRRRNAKVLCMPSTNDRNDITEIYKPIGIPNKNIYAISNNKEECEKIKSNFRRINIIQTDILKNKAIHDIINTSIKFDLVYIDLLGPYESRNMGDIINFAMKNNSIFGITCQGAREKSAYKKFISLLGVNKCSFLANEIIFETIYWPLIKYVLREHITKLSAMTYGMRATKKGIMAYEFYKQKWHRYEIVEAYKLKIMKEIIKKNKYIFDGYKTIYPTLSGHAKMSTFFCKLRSASFLPDIGFWRKLSEIEKKINNKPITEIKHIDGKVDIGINKEPKFKIKKPYKNKQKILHIGMFPEPEYKKEICERFCMDGREYAAIKAHITRGTYKKIYPEIYK
jgi:hypothetical protein